GGEVPVGGRAPGRRPVSVARWPWASPPHGPEPRPAPASLPPGLRDSSWSPSNAWNRCRGTSLPPTFQFDIGQGFRQSERAHLGTRAPHFPAKAAQCARKPPFQEGLCGATGCRSAGELFPGAGLAGTATTPEATGATEATGSPFATGAVTGTTTAGMAVG